MARYRPYRLQIRRQKRNKESLIDHISGSSSKLKPDTSFWVIPHIYFRKDKSWRPQTPQLPRRRHSSLDQAFKDWNTHLNQAFPD